MMDFVIGQYIKKDSFIHNLDPRTKIILSAIICISIFLIQTFVGYFIMFFLIFISIIASKTNIKLLFKGSKPIFILIIITVIFNIFFTSGKPVFKVYGVSITDKGLFLSAVLVVRLILLLFTTTILTLTTSPIELTDGFENIFKPLNKIKFPVHEIALMMSIALRFIPTLAEETDKIMKAQMSRGADFETGGFIKRAKALVPILIPLFVSAFKRADELATAMEARCYKGAIGRTKLKKLEYTKKDIITYLVSLLLIITAVYLG
ncbi:energy-coupling factor transporter transmembrane protein EcfT [Caldicellulosiruptoraceae bacterium PP1]